MDVLQWALMLLEQLKDGFSKLDEVPGVSEAEKAALRHARRLVMIACMNLRDERYTLAKAKDEANKSDPPD